MMGMTVPTTGEPVPMMGITVPITGEPVPMMGTPVPMMGEPVPIPMGATAVASPYVELDQMGLAMMTTGRPVPAETTAVPVTRTTGIGVTVAVTMTMLVSLAVPFKGAAVALLSGVGWYPPVTSEGSSAGNVAVKLKAGATMVATGTLELTAAGSETPVGRGIMTLNSPVTETAVGKIPTDPVALRTGKGAMISITEGVATGDSSGAVEKTGVRKVALMAVVSDPTGSMDMISPGAEVTDDASELETDEGSRGRTSEIDAVSTGAGVGVTIMVAVGSGESSLGPKRRSKKSWMRLHALRWLKSSLTS
jgi:hypothetical protein